MFKCSICGKQVSRRKSYAIGDGKRACREHQEAQEASAKLQAETKRAHAAGTKPRKVREKKEPKRFDMPSCWGCMLPGIPAWEFYQRVLIDWKKYEFTHPNEKIIPGLVNSERFDSELRAKLKRLGVEAVLYFLKEPAKGFPQEFMDSLSQDQMMAFDVVHAVWVCQECADKYGLLLPEPPKVTVEQMFKLGSLTQPIYEQQALAEMARDN